MTPILFNTPTDTQSWLFWGTTHQLDHFGIVDGIFGTIGTQVPMLPIDPVPLNDPNMMLVWFLNHQAIHNAMNAALGQAGSDLSMVDFRDSAQAAYWIENNALEHQNISAAIAYYQLNPPQQMAGAAQNIPGPSFVVPSAATAVQILGQPYPNAVQPQIGGVQSQPSPILPQPSPVQPQAAASPASIAPQPGPTPAPGQLPGTPSTESGGTPMIPGTPGSGSAPPAP
jgi:hypothetical protein